LNFKVVNKCSTTPAQPLTRLTSSRRVNPHHRSSPNLERLGLRPKPRSPAQPEQQPLSREEQLAILERIAAEDEAKARNSQEGKEPA